MRRWRHDDPCDPDGRDPSEGRMNDHEHDHDANPSTVHCVRDDVHETTQDTVHDTFNEAVLDEVQQIVPVDAERACCGG